jgi:glycerol-3-phosphate dehydrogenase (NAD(P)+)
MGNFGFALLKHLDKKAVKSQFSLHIYDRNKKLRDSLRKRRAHLIHYKNIKISKKVIIEESPKDLVRGADILILAVTSNAIRKVLIKIKNYINKKIIILNTAKVLDSITGERFSVIISNCLKHSKCPFSVVMMAGGTIARDLLNEEPLGTDIAADDHKALKILRNVLVFVYTTSDIVGVEYAAAFKNVVSISAGIMKGSNFSYGSETHIISRLSGEIKKLVVTKLGGKCATFSTESQCWGNDMFMSAMGNTRNKEFGVLLGKGHTVKRAL